VKIVVVVVDNEGEPNNQALVEDFSPRCHFPVHYIHEPRRGIPQARNAALEKCRSLRADWLAFTDDDCWVSPTWLDSLLEAAARHNADAPSFSYRVATRRNCFSLLKKRSTRLRWR
jgi:glycosyltransferase involved in cell wall biosynthesis